LNDNLQALKLAELSEVKNTLAVAEKVDRMLGNNTADAQQSL
jgi:hypothetical protein